MSDQGFAFPTSEKSWRPRMANRQQFLTLSPQDQKDYVRGLDGNYYLNTAIKVVPRPLKKAAPPAFGANQSSGGNLANILANKAALAPVFKIDPKDVDKRFQDYRGIMSKMPGMSTEVYDKMLKQAEDSARLNMGLAMMQAGFGAAAAPRQKGESTFSTLSRTLFQPLSAAAMQTMGAARKEKMAAQLGKLQAEGRISTAALQAAMADETTMRKALIELAGKKDKGFNLSHKYGVNITVDKAGTKSTAENANVVIMANNKTGETLIRTVGDTKGKGPDGQPISIGAGSLVKNMEVDKRGENIKTKFAENVVMEGWTTHDGDKVPFVTIGNAYIQGRSKIGERPVQTLMGFTQGTITLKDGTTKDVILKDGTIIDSYHKYTEPKDTLTQWFNPTDRDIILPYLFRGEEIQKVIRPGESNAIKLRQADVNRILDQNPLAMDKLRKVSAQTAISTEKKTYVNTGPDALIIGNKTIKPNGTISISPRELQEFPDHVFRNLKAVGKPTRESSTVYIQRPDKDAELVEKVVVSPANPEQPSIVLYYDNKGKKIPKGEFEELTDTHDSPTVTEKLILKSPQISKKVSKALNLEIAAGDEIEIRTSAAKGGTGLDDIKEYWIFGKKLNSRIVENLIKANSFQTRALTKEQAIEAGDVPQYSAPVDGGNLYINPRHKGRFEGALNLGQDTVMSGDVLKTKLIHPVPGAPDTVKTKTEVYYRGKLVPPEVVENLRNAGAIQAQPLTTEQKEGEGQVSPFEGPTHSKLQVTASDAAGLEAVRAVIPGIKTGATINVSRSERKAGSKGEAKIIYTYGGAELPPAAVQALINTGHLKTPGAITMPQKREAKLVDEPQPQQTKLFFNPTTTQIGTAQPGGFANWTPKDLANLSDEERTKVRPFDALGPTTVFTAKVDGDNIDKQFDFMDGKIKGGQTINLANLDLAGMKEADRKLFTTRFVSGESASKREVRKVDLNNAFKQYQIDTKAPGDPKNLTGSELSNLFGQFPSTRAINQSKLKEAFQRLIPAETGKMATTEKAYETLRKKEFVSTVPWAELPYIERAAWDRVPRDVYRRDQQQINAAFEKQYKALEDRRDKFIFPNAQDQANFSQTLKMYTLLGEAEKYLGDTGLIEGTFSNIFATFADWDPRDNPDEVRLKSILQEFESQLGQFATPEKGARPSNWRLELIQKKLPKFTTSETLNRLNVARAKKALEDNIIAAFSTGLQEKNFIPPEYVAAAEGHGINVPKVDRSRYAFADPKLEGVPFSTKVGVLQALGHELLTNESFDNFSPLTLLPALPDNDTNRMFLKIDKTSKLNKGKCDNAAGRCVIETQDGKNPAPGAEAFNFTIK